jgi:phospholipase/carboxylesterase
MDEPALGPGDPHRAYRVIEQGTPLARARAVMIMLHGRGGSAEDMMALADVLAQPDLACLAPQAAGHSWYPYPFTAPIERNEPWLSSALRVIDALLERLAEAGFGPERVALLGFSQGACLELEYAARHARRYAGVIGLSGGLIGPEGTPRDYPGSLAGTPVFLGCSDVDPHIPLARVRETTAVLQRLGADVTERIYPGMGRLINEDEVGFVRGLLAALVQESPRPGSATT